MKATIFTEAGNVDSIKTVEWEIPEPKETEVQIAVKATSLSVGDFKSFAEKKENGKVSFMTKVVTAVNKPFGGDISGIVTKVGRKVKGIHVGDDVYASIGTSGGCAEYITVNMDRVFLKPCNLSYEEAAAIPTSGIVAMAACRKAKIKQGAKVLVYGASGGVGQFAVEVAKAMGANVTAVCSTRNVQIAYSIGADTVVDYKKEDITTKGLKFDVVLGVNGGNSLHTYKELLTTGGTYIAIGGTQAASGILGPIYSLGSGKNMTFVVYASAVKQSYLNDLKELAENDEIKPFIEQIYVPSEIKQAIDNICKNHAQGKIVVSIKY